MDLHPAYELSPDGKSITCGHCGRTSHHPADVLMRYCAACDLMHEEGRPRRPEDVEAYRQRTLDGLMDGPLRAVELYAWLGEDEHGSGVIGLKQALTPAGLIPLVATERGKVAGVNLARQLQAQADRYGKTIVLCRYRLEAVDMVLRPNPSGPGREDGHGR